jgi:uncharacterized protein (UPF0262 family)
MKFKLVPVFARLVQVEFEDGLTTSFLDTRDEADVRLCDIIQALANNDFEYVESDRDTPGLKAIITKSAR